jgi:hypothetical protein
MNTKARRRRWLDFVGLILLCGLSFASYRNYSSYFGATFSVFTVQKKANSHLKQMCLQEEKKEQVDLQCDHLRLRVGVKGAERKGFSWGIGKPIKPTWIAPGWTRDRDNNFFLILEVMMSNEGKLLRSQSVYADGNGQRIARPRDYMTAESDYTPTADTGQTVEYVEPLGPEPEKKPESDYLMNTDVGPDFQLEVEPR